MDRDPHAREHWHRYRRAIGSRAPEEPSTMMLAAYAARTLGPRDRAIVEAWLARNPDRFDDVLAARRASSLRAAAHVQKSWRDGAGWGVAICGLLLAAWMGFDLGQASVGVGDGPEDRDTALIVAVLYDSES